VPSNLKLMKPPAEAEAAQGLMARCSEALIITVDKRNHIIAVHHKLKSHGGVLNDYLASLLAQVLQSARHDQEPDYLHQAATNPTAGSS